MIGPALAIGLSAIGSAIGCGIAWEAAVAVMSRVEEGHGKFIAIASAPSSQVIYGFILMLFLARAVTAGTLAPLSAIGVGGCGGAAIMIGAIYQGRVCASGIQATAKQPAIFGKCLAGVGVVESFALFAFVFSLMLI